MQLDLRIEMHLSPPLCFGALQFAFPKNFGLVNKMYNSIAVQLQKDWFWIIHLWLDHKLKHPFQTSKNISCKPASAASVFDNFAPIVAVQCPGKISQAVWRPNNGVLPPALSWSQVT